MKTCAIVQPNFFPWIGYFEIIKYVDEFILLDDVQYTRRDWRNRNVINNNGKKLYINIPVQTKNNFLTKINEIQTHGDNWKNENLKKIYHCYKKTKFFDSVYELIKTIIENNNKNLLSNTVTHGIIQICNYLNIETKIILSSNLKLNNFEDKNEKLIKICKTIGARRYISGPIALNYLDYKKFSNHNVKLLILNYKNQINYIEDQNFKFLEKMSIIDLLFHQGKNAKKFLQKLDLSEIL